MRIYGGFVPARARVLGADGSPVLPAGKMGPQRLEKDPVKLPPLVGSGPTGEVPDRAEGAISKAGRSPRMELSPSVIEGEMKSASGT